MRVCDYHSYYIMVPFYRLGFYCLLWGPTTFSLDFYFMSFDYSYFFAVYFVLLIFFIWFSIGFDLGAVETGFDLWLFLNSISSFY